MFGELIGAWAATVWQQMGAPQEVRLVELGPGRGTLMADALRAAKALPDFAAAAFGASGRDESGAARRAEDEARAANCPVAWHAQIEDVPEGPCIAIANEFVDALPVDQFVRGSRRLAHAHGRHRGRSSGVRGVARCAAGAHGDRRATRRDPGIAARSADRDVWRSASRATAARRSSSTTATPKPASATRCRRCAATSMPTRSPIRAKPISPRRSISPRSRAPRGARAHRRMVRSRRANSCAASASRQRAARLKANATPQQAADIDAALARLTAGDQMGELFKVLAIAHPSLGALPGFDS